MSKGEYLIQTKQPKSRAVLGEEVTREKPVLSDCNVKATL